MIAAGNVTINANIGNGSQPFAHRSQDRSSVGIAPLLEYLARRIEHRHVYVVGATLAALAIVATAMAGIALPLQIALAWVITFFLAVCAYAARSPRWTGIALQAASILLVGGSYYAYLTGADAAAAGALASKWHGVTWITALIPTGIFLGSYAVAATIVYRSRYRPAMDFHPSPLVAEYGTRDDVRSLRNLREQLKNHLDDLDSQTDWRASSFVPLDAEVEVFQADRRASRVVDLYEGLRRGLASRFFVVLGDPGSGKSVSLRKLARDLLKESMRSGRLPLYVNLKEWRPTAPWTREGKPTVEELTEFIISSVQQRLAFNSGGHDFFQANFPRLLASGRLFLILDSFDEIPQLLDATDASWLVKGLSDVVTSLVTGSADGRGIVASRLFRQPEITREEYCRLDIRPLSDIKVAVLIRQQAGAALATQIESAIFALRPDLAAAGRNPLLLTLLVEYVKRNDELPRTQYAMFQSHMDRSVREALKSVEYRDLDAATIWQTTEAIARAMFAETNFGLEMPIAALRKRLEAHDVERIAGFLVHARLGRIGSPGFVFSFVHRRFNEFFLVQWLREDVDRPESLAHTIPEDGRWRDALALYAEVATPAEAELLASYCFEELSPLLNFRSTPGEATYARSLHCLRFLIDAFRGSPNVLLPYQDRLAKFIETALENDDILVRKNAVEAVGLVSATNADALIGEAFASGDSWVRETAFRSCRYLPAITESALTGVSTFFFALPATAVLKEYGQLRLVFSLSEPFRSLRRLLPARRADAMMAVILPVFTIIVFPLPALLLLAMWAFFAIIDISSAGRRRAFLRTKSNLGFFELRKVYLMMLGQLLVFGPILYFVYGGRIADAMTAATQESVARSLTPYVLPTAIIYVLAALVVLMALPYASAMRSLTRISTWPVTPADPKAALTGIGGAILAIAVFLGFVRGVFWLAESFPKIMTIVTSIFSLIGIGAICTGAIPELVRRLRDWFRFRELRGTVPISRVQIARSLDEFRTGPGRLFYVRWLLSKAPELDEALSNPDDEWPDHNRPNYDNDEASALLAKLEERWLGLAR